MSSITKQIVVTQCPPVALFTYEPVNPTVYDTIQFTDLSYDFDGLIQNWTWVFDDGTISYLQHPTHQFPLEGTYAVCLQVEDDNSTTDTYCINISVIDVGPLDVNQSVYDRGFPIRSAMDGAWGGAQNFTTTLETLTFAEIFVRKFGTPEFNLSVEFRTGSIEGSLIETLSFTPEEISTNMSWLFLDFTDFSLTADEDYYLVCSPPSGVTTSFGYEWGYAFGDVCEEGSFWFTRDGGNLWRDLPTMYDFTIRIYGIH
jgi:PKD repeat protein